MCIKNVQKCFKEKKKTILSMFVRDTSYQLWMYFSMIFQILTKIAALKINILHYHTLSQVVMRNHTTQLAKRYVPNKKNRARKLSSVTCHSYESTWSFTPVLFIFFLPIPSPSAWVKDESLLTEIRMRQCSDRYSFRLPEGEKKQDTSKDNIKAGNDINIPNKSIILLQSSHRHKYMMQAAI